MINVAQLRKSSTLTTLMNTKEGLQKFNDVVLISKKKYISLANSEHSIESITTGSNEEVETLQKTKPSNRNDDQVDNRRKCLDVINEFLSLT